MSEIEGEDDIGAQPMGIGAQLRAAREAKGLSVEQVAAETRIPIRHLQTIEAGRFGDMPGKTYATGFARTYAKLVGLDSEDVTAMVRAELDAEDARGDERRAATFEPGDPSRAPGRGLVWFSVFAVILVLVGLGFASRAIFAPAGELPSLVQPEETAAPQAAATSGAKGVQQAATAPRGGPVVFTAEGPTWVRFTDASGARLFEAQMTKGQTFTVPADADAPVLITGRPDLLSITVGGRPVPKISEDLQTVVDVPVSAEALLARPPAPPASPAGSAPASPAATAN